MIHLLDEKFEGKGETKGFSFSLIEKTDTHCLYEVVTGEESKHYELIKLIISPVCIDFENRIYSETEFKQSYPKAATFGTNGWTFYQLESAMKRFEELKLSHGSRDL